MLRRLPEVVALALCTGCFAAPTVTYIPSGFMVGSLSFDGTAGAGNVVGDNSYETFRWTVSGGTERLGLASFPAISRASGTPNVSYNGKRVSASILSSDYQLTQGLWDVNTGWTETMPASPPGGGLVDDGYGSAWGLSGNGEHLTGFFWTPSYRATASSWSPSGGMIALGQSDGRSARANAANYDGSVCGGWEENSWGSWMPRAWRNGVKYELNNDDGGVNMVEGISGSGDILVGSCRDDELEINVATIWRWNGASYDTDRVGALPYFLQNQTTAEFTGVSNDGSIAVGFHMMIWGTMEGIVWTPATGLVSAADFFTGAGLALPDTYQISDCSAVSADGSTIAVSVNDTETFEFFTAIIRLRAVCPGDLNNDGIVDDADFVSFAAQYDILDCADGAMPGYCRADINNDGLVEDVDFVLFVQAYDQLVCP